MDRVKIVNIKQASMYIKNGLKPTDIYYTDKLVFVFNTDETKEVFEMWKNHSLTQKGFYMKKTQNDIVNIFIMRQAKLYIKNGLQPLKVEYDEEHDVLVYVFDKKESQPYFYKWCNHELN